MLGQAVICGVSVAWLAEFVGFERVMAAGVVPFLIGDMVKVGITMLLLPAG